MKKRDKALVDRKIPEEWEDICGHKDHIKNFKNWLEKGYMPPLCLYGPNGSGKTATLNVYLRKLYGKTYDHNVRVINASKQSDSGVGFINNVIDNDMKFEPVGDFAFRVIVFEEAEKISSKGQRSLKVAIDEKKHVICIFITNFPGEMDKGLLGEGARTHPMFFGNPTPTDKHEWLDHIYDEEIEDEFTEMNDDILDFVRATAYSNKTPRGCLISFDAKLYGSISSDMDIEITAKLFVDKLFAAKGDKVKRKTVFIALMELYDNFQMEFPDNERILLKFMHYHAKSNYMTKYPIHVGELSKSFADTDIPLQNGVNANLHISKMLNNLAKAFGV